MTQNTLLISRISISAFFFTNGFLYANWTSRLPELQKYFGLNDGQLGIVLFYIALGSIVGMPLAGFLCNKFGSHKMVRIYALLFCIAIPMVAFSQNVWLIKVLFFFLGASSGSLDVSMNSQAVLVERLWGKIIFSSFHAVFSIGMALGAASGSLFSGFGIALQPHLWFWAIVFMVVVASASTKLVKEHPDKSTSIKEKIEGSKWKALIAILPFGVIAFCCMTGEGAMVDWSAIFMNKVVGQSEVISAWAFATFGIAMTIGRTFGDCFIERYGKRKMMFFDAIIATIGLGLSLFFANFTFTFIGFFLVGLGLSTIVPIAFSSAGNLKSVSPSVGISMVTSIGYSGFFIGPPTIGYLSEVYDLSIGLSFVLALFVIMILLTLNYLLFGKKSINT
jgi:MFS family permease